MRGGRGCACVRAQPHWGGDLDIRFIDAKGRLPQRTRDSVISRVSPDKRRTGKSSPLDIKFDVPLVFNHLPFHLLVERTHRNPFSEYLQSHSLPDVTLQAYRIQQRFRGPAQHIDKAWSDRQAQGVDLGSTADRAYSTNRGNDISLNSYIGDERCVSGAIISSSPVRTLSPLLGSPFPRKPIKCRFSCVLIVEKRPCVIIPVVTRSCW